MISSRQATGHHPTTSVGVAMCAAFGLPVKQPAPPPACSTSSGYSRALEFLRKIKGATHIVCDQSNIFRGGFFQGGAQIDMGEVLRHLGGDDLAMATAVVSDANQPRPQQEGFYNYLESIGWRVLRYPVLRQASGAFQENEKLVDGAVRQLITAAAYAANIQTVCVLSGDGGMTRAVQNAVAQGKKVFVVAWANTLHPALAAAASANISLEDLLPLIRRVRH